MAEVKVLPPIPQFLIVQFLIVQLLIPLPRPSPQTSESLPISISSTGALGNGPSSSPSISADGRWIAFASAATNLVPADTNNAADIFVHDHQTGETTRVSVSTHGEQADGDSARPAISGNGRFVAFQSDATNLVPADTNGLTDIFLHDRLTGETKRVSVGIHGQQANGPSENVTIAHDGRYLAYQTLASNLVLGDDNGAWDVYIYDNGVTGNVIRASVSSEGVGGDAASTLPAISGDGRFVAYLSDAGNLVAGDNDPFADVFVYQRVLAQTEQVSVGVDGLAAEAPAISHTGRNVVFVLWDGADGRNLYQHDRQDARTFWLGALPDATLAHRLALSADAQALLLYTIAAEGARLIYWDLQNGAQTALPAGAEPAFALSADRRAVVYSVGGQVYLWERAPASLTHFLAGRVTDPLGRPLALVTIADQSGHSTRTGLDGYFWLAGYTPGPVTLTLEKEGFTLQPSSLSLDVVSDLPGLAFTAHPEQPLAEARRDLGMPYTFTRGCPDPYQGCGGPYHGFYSGYCTDLILDAYTYGANFNIQFDLEQNARAHPEHFYRWRDARNAHDMWRFFAYTGQMYANTAPYAPGDIVFFDWTEDGEIDHVALVSEVDENNRPVRLLDATGLTNFNPSGLAAELEWLDFHTRTARGHARWSGAYQPVVPFPAQTQMLQVAASGGNVNLRLAGPAGGAMSLTENSLPGGWYANLIWEEVASVENPLAGGGAYTVEISNPGAQPAPFRLAIQLVAGGIVIGRVEASGNLPPGAVQHVPVFVSLAEGGNLALRALPGQVPKIKGILTNR